MQITGFNAEHGMANHIRHKHSKDTRGPYQCSKDGCEYFHVCLYKLAAHEEKCKAVSAMAKEEHASLRFKMNKAAMDNQPPTFIIVNRSSSHAPEEWKAGTGDIKTGLPFVGKQILAHFAAKCGLSSGAAVPHSSYECQTRKIPALAHDLSYLETQNHQKKMVWRGFKFTQAIVNDITVANNAGIKPFLISQGLDGWACDVRMIHPWLQATKLQLELVIKTNALQFGLDSTFAEQHGGVFWWHHNPQDILQALEDGHGNNPKADQLIASWRICQSHKDGQFGVKKRRNFVDMNVSYPALD
ncbi:hypothetical protein N0V94_004880 [Neodidymelliopsis sp. IMI 364377]|nr:hypothetical protein N0V94_004880 [Neodidymelliopsis sp. IMI 364377]